MNRHVSQNAGMAGFSGLVLLLFGFLYPISPAFDRGEFYEFLFDLFRWTLRLGGISLLIIAGVCMMGQRIGLLLDALTSGIIGGLLLLCAGGWIFYERGVDMTNIVVFLVSLMMLREGYGNFILWRMTGEDLPHSRPRAPAIEAPPVKISSNILPKDGEPPPPEGYLAALAKEKDE